MTRLARPSPSIDPLGHRVTTYYLPDREQATANALGDRSTTLFDLLGRTSATINPLGYRSTMLYTATDQVERG